MLVFDNDENGQPDIKYVPKDKYNNRYPTPKEIKEFVRKRNELKMKQTGSDRMTLESESEIDDSHNECTD